MRIFYALITLAILVFPAFTQSESSEVPRPQVLVRNKSPKPPPPPAKSGTGNLFSSPNSVELGTTNELLSVRYIVNPDGTFKRVLDLRRSFSKGTVNSPLYKWRVPFNADLTQMQIEDAEIIAKNGDRRSFPSENIKIQKTPQSEAAPEFSSLSEIFIDFAGLKAGESVEFRIISEFGKTLFPGTFDAVEYVSPFDAYRLARYSFELPKGMNLYFSEKGFGAPTKIEKKNGNVEWTWSIQNRKAQRIEVGMPDITVMAPTLVVSNSPDWERFGKQYASATDQKARVTQQIKSLGDEITKGASSDSEKASLIYDWVNRNITYLLVFLDRGGWIPRDTEDILENKFGDCKDYTLLMQALLKSQGIESEPVVLRAGGSEWYPRTQAYMFYNHMILYIPSLEVFADATVPRTKIGELADQVRGKTGFRLGSKFEPITIPKGDAGEVKVSAEAIIDLLPNGDLDLRSEIFLGGGLGNPMRLLLGSPNMKFLGPAFDLQYEARNMSVEGKVIRFEESKEDIGIEIDYSGRFPGYSKLSRKGELKLPPVNLLFEDQTFRSILEMKERTTPLMIQKISYEEVLEIKMPGGFRLTLPHPAKSFENEMGSYSRRIFVEAGKTRVKRSIVFCKSLISVSEFPAFRNFLKSWLDDGYSTFSYSVDPGTKLVAQTAAQNKSDGPAKNAFEKLFERIGLGENIAVTKKEAIELEKRVSTNPEDFEARKKLISYYDNNLQDPKNRRQIVSHLVWLVRNRPTDWGSTVFWWRIEVEPGSPGSKSVKQEWLSVLGEQPDKPGLRLIAADFFRGHETELAIKLLDEGAARFKDDYRFSAEKFKILYSWINGGEDFDEKPLPADTRKRAFEIGRAALEILRSGRRDDADRDYLELLTGMTELGFQLGAYDSVKRSATEMILMFGSSAAVPGFDEATHFGNIFLGKLALLDGDTDKSGEYLMISVRAPLRKKPNSVHPKMDLAKDLFEAGKKQVVSDYLEECLKLEVFTDEDYPDKESLKAVNKWIAMIKEGKTPSFDYDNP
ncbi:MAG: DUF3857 domain-containing protein [Pyrinomonadaceae bacterium]|nr:DUF3857 domain-containing protein [Pyrinomonadaceae bacterium]